MSFKFKNFMEEHAPKLSPPRRAFALQLALMAPEASFISAHASIKQTCKCLAQEDIKVIPTSS